MAADLVEAADRVFGLSPYHVEDVVALAATGLAVSLVVCAVSLAIASALSLGLGSPIIERTPHGAP